MPDRRRRLLQSAALAAGLAALALAVPRGAAAQDPPRQPVRADSSLRTPTRGDSAARPDTARADSAAARAAAASADPVTRFLGGFTARNIGPAAFGGRVTALAFPRPYRKTFYVGSAGGGVWKTTNGGISFRPVSDSTGAGSVGDLAVAPSDSNVVWVGTGEKNSLRSQGWGNGVWRSGDGGRTWRHMGLAGTRAIGRVVVHPRDPNVVWVAALGRLWGPNAERGVYKTTDGGRTWSKVLFVNDTTGFVDLEMDPSNPEVLYAAAWHRLRWGGTRIQGVGAGSGIYRTADGGRTWTRLTDPARRNGLPADRMGRIGLAVSEKSPRVVYAMVQVDRGVTTASVNPQGGVFRSADAGQTWQHVHDFQSIPHYYYNDVWTDPTDAGRLWVSSTFLMKSADSGRTFEAESLHNVHVDHHAMWVNPEDPDHRVLGNDGGVYQTRDGGRAWEHLVLPIGQAYTITVDSSVAPYHVCMGLQDNGSWCGPSQTRDTTGVTDADWYAVGGGDGMWVQVPWHDPHTIYSEFQFGSISRLDLKTGRRDVITPLTIDAGAESNYQLTWGWTTPLLLSQHDSTVLYAGANRLVRFTKRGDDWELLGPDMTRANRERPEPEAGHTSYHAIFSIAEGPTNRNLLWTGSDDGLVWLSRDGGRAWTEVGKNLPAGAPQRCFVGTIVASRHAEGTAYLALDCHHRDDERPHLYATADYGATWRAVAAGLPADGGSHTIAEHAVNPRVLFAGTERGAYASIDGGATWRRFPRSLPPVSVHRLAMHSATRDLVIGTHGRGAWVVNVAAMDSVAPAALDARAALYPIPPAYQYRRADTHPSFGSRPWVAPNPAKGAQIGYWLREAQTGPVRVVITDAAGDTVRTIQAPGYAGHQRAAWDLTRDKPRPRAKGDPASPAELRQVDPGEYVVAMRVGDQTYRQRVRVLAWPADRRGRVR